ncbi:MAG: hypothetical protein ACE5JH_11335, partial [Acidobacteriota bacterium]
VEQRRLDSALQRHSENARAQEAARDRLGLLLRELEAMVEGRVEADPELIDYRDGALQQAERTLEALFRDGRQIRSAIRDAHQRIEILQERIDRLRRTLPADNEALTGVWDVTYLPSGDTGAFTLRQSGTLLSGEYVMEGGWKGSLQGTFVDGKVLLHRIDSKLGRSSDLEGRVSPDGRTLRGTWENYVLTGGQPTSGSWVARKRVEEPRP